MAEYKEVHGTKIRNYTTNPDNPIVGEVWYNETDQVLKFSYPSVTTSGAWASAGALNTARTNLDGAGSRPAAIAFGGQVGATLYANTELYNGAWTEVNNLNTARYAAGPAGSQTSALCFGGNKVPSP